MPQLKEDEWPKDHEPTTEEKQLKDDEKPPAGTGSPEYPPKLPPDALPTTD